MTDATIGRGGITVVGEGMLEIATSRGSSRFGYGGDAINVAVHLARSGLPVRFASALGDDPYSADLRRTWADEGIDTRLLLVMPGRLPGLYAGRTDDAGERSFFYWRSESAARAMFEAPGVDAMVAAAAESDLLFFSLISLAVLPPAGRERLLELCAAVRARGGRVAFDGNYRARLWDDVGSARAWRDRAIAVADIGLPTLGDEIEMGATDDAAAVATRWRAGGAPETVVKLGAAGCLVDGRIVAPRACAVTDTSGAGDAFNAGYLAARIGGAAPAAAAQRGHALAGWTIGHMGAIPARDAAAPYPARAAESR